MTARLNARVAATNGGRHERTLATLPNQWRSVPDGACDAAVMDADSRALEAAVAAGARLVLIEGAADAGPDALKVLHAAVNRRSAIVAVVCDLPYRLWADGALDGADATPWALVESIAVSPGSAQLRQALFEQITVARHVFGATGAATLLHADADQYLVELHGAGGALVVLSGAVNQGAAGGITFDAVSMERRIEISAGPAATARPAAILLSSSGGSASSFPVHQTGMRLAWQAAGRRLSGEAGKLLEFSQAYDDLMAVAEAFGGQAGHSPDRIAERNSAIPDI